MALVYGAPLNPIVQGKLQNNAVEQIVPSSMKWYRPKTGVPIDRSRYKLDAQQTTYRTDGNKIIRFELPNTFFADFSRGCLDLNVEIFAPGGTYARLSQGANCLFDRLLISTGIEIEDIRSYNLLSSLLTTVAVESDVHEVIGHALYGYGSQAERNAWGAPGVSTQYLVPVFSSFLNTGLLPLGFVKDKIAVEFYMADPSTIVETDSPGPVIIQITDAELHYDRIVPDDSYTKSVAGALSSSGLTLGAKIFEHYYNALQSNRATVNINHRSDSLSALITVMREDSTVNDMTVNDKLVNYFKFGLTQHQLKINSAFYPQEPIDTTGRAVEAYLGYLEYLGKWGLHGTFKSPPMITGPQFNLDKFLIINDMEQHPDEPGLINPIGTKHSSSTLFIDLLFAAAPPVRIRADTFVQYYVTYTITPDGKITRYF